MYFFFFSAAPEEEGSDVLPAATGALWTGHCGSAAQGKSTLEPLPAPKPTWPEPTRPIQMPIVLCGLFLDALDLLKNPAGSQNQNVAWHLNIIDLPGRRLKGMCLWFEQQALEEVL